MAKTAASAAAVADNKNANASSSSPSPSNTTAPAYLTQRQRAISTLEALLVESNPWECSHTNVLCALSQSAILLRSDGPGAPAFPGKYFAQLLQQALDVAHELVVTRTYNPTTPSVAFFFTVRDLCGVAATVAKHYLNMPQTVLPSDIVTKSVLSSSSLSSNPSGTSSKLSPQERTEQLLWEVADQLSRHLEADLILHYHHSSSTKQGKEEEEDEKLSPALSSATITARGEDESDDAFGNVATAVVVAEEEEIAKAPSSFSRSLQLASAVWAFATIRSKSSPDMFFSNNNHPYNVVSRLFDVAGATFCDLSPENARGLNYIQDCGWTTLVMLSFAYSTCRDCRRETAESVMMAIVQETTARVENYARADRLLDTPFMAHEVLKIASAAGDTCSSLSSSSSSSSSLLEQLLLDLIHAMARRWRSGEKIKSLVMTEQQTATKDKPPQVIHRRCRPLAQFNPDDFCLLGKCLAQLRYPHNALVPDLFQEALEIVRQDLGGGGRGRGRGRGRGPTKRHNFTKSQLVELLRVQAHLSLRPFTKFAKSAVQLLHQRLVANEDAGEPLPVQDYVQLVWSMTVLEFHRDDTSISLLRHAFSQLSLSWNGDNETPVLSTTQAQQLSQVFAMLQCDCPEVLSEGVSDDLRRHVEERTTATRQTKANDDGDSGVARLRKALDAMGVAHHVLSDIPNAIVVEAKDDVTKPVVTLICWDDDLDFSRHQQEVGESRVLLGHAALTLRLLNRRNTPVLHVSSAEANKSDLEEVLEMRLAPYLGNYPLFTGIGNDSSGIGIGADETFETGGFSVVPYEVSVKKTGSIAPNDICTKRLDEAIATLKTVLEAPVTRRNRSNLIFALTKAAGLLNVRAARATKNRIWSWKESYPLYENEFCPLLLQTMDRLHELILSSSVGRFNVGQICNAACAVARHVRLNPALVPAAGGNTHGGQVFSTRTLRRTEMWDLQAEVAKPDGLVSTTEAPVEETVDTTVETTLKDLAIKLQEQLDQILAGNGLTLVDGQVQQLRLVFAAMPSQLCQTAWAYAFVQWIAHSKKMAGWGEDEDSIFPEMSLFGNFDDNNNVEGEEWSGVAYFRHEAFSEGDFGTRTTSTTGGGTDPLAEGQEGQGVPGSVEVSGLFESIALVLGKGSTGGTSATVDVEGTAEELNGDQQEELQVSEDDWLSHQPLKNCSWQDLAVLSWAYASSGHYNTEAAERLLLSILDEASTRLQSYDSSADDGAEDFIPLDISQIAWSAGIIQRTRYRVGDGLAAFVEAISHRFVGNGTTSTPPFHEWGTANLVRLAVALCHGRIDDGNLLAAIYNEALLVLQQKGSHTAIEKIGARQFSNSELVALVWVQARLFLRSEQDPVYESFTAAALETLWDRSLQNGLDAQVIDKNGKSTANAELLESMGLGEREQANLAWSLTVLEQFKSPGAVALLQTMFHAMASRYEQATARSSVKRLPLLQSKHAHQLWQAVFLLQQDCPEAVENLSLEFQEELKLEWNREKRRYKESSARHMALSKTLSLMGVAHFNEHDEDIDVAIIVKDSDAKWTSLATTSVAVDEQEDSAEAEKEDEESLDDQVPFKLAVEFDGPMHFTRIKESGGARGREGGPSKQPVPAPCRAMGHTVLKYRVLKKQGWTVVRVPFYEFDKIPFWASMERQRYVQRLLKTHAKVRFSDKDFSEYKAIVANRQSRFD